MKENITLNTNAQAVMDVLQTMKQHPTALEVYNVVRDRRPHIGLATVYRILHQLTELGLIKALGRESECRYDTHIQRHDHAICTVCGTLLDIPIDIVLSSETLRMAAQATGFELNSYEVRIYGRCTTCQRDNT